LNLEQKLENELQKASEYFSKYKEKIELPNIQPPVQEVDENYEAYKASSAKANEDYTNVIVPAIKALTPEQVQFTVSVNDPNNNMVFDLPVVAAADDFEKAKQDSLSLSDFLAKTCYDKDGKFIPKELAEMIYLKQNFGKLSQTIARQAVNAERKRVLSKESGLGSGAAKDYNVDAPVTQLQKLEKLAFG